MFTPIKIINHEKVVSCNEASSARKIHLHQELKTLLLKVCQYEVAVHLRGSDNLNSKALKALFKCKESSFLKKNELSKRGLQPGIINPWNTGFCNFHLICKKVFNNQQMATNNSRLDQGVFFDVYELLKRPNAIVGNFGVN